MKHITPWLRIPVEALLRPIPDVDDRLTDELLRFGRFLPAGERATVGAFTLAPKNFGVSIVSNILYSVFCFNLRK